MRCHGTVQDHQVSIELLTPSYTATAGKNLGLFPDHYVEGATLFKRSGKYYVGYGSCCCFCRGGSGWVVYSSTSMTGPWTRQPLDVNCNSTTPGVVCGAYGERVGDPITISAQARCSLAVGTCGRDTDVWFQSLTCF